MERPATPTDRLETFSDGVFAVAITLLVLGLKVHAPAGQLTAKLAAAWPYYATYAVSFLTIGIIWMNHHAQFDRIERADRTLMLLNLLLLLCVTVIPFPTGLLAGHFSAPSDQHIAAAVYAGTLLAMSLAFFSTYIWATRAKLFRESIAARHTGYLLRRNGAGMLGYVAALAVAFVSAPVSLALCGAVAVYYIHPGRRLD
ncbi:MAG: TMEM175 family protein [Solirubrobacteraceae bacterium]|jgi:uncharacterized membrane protein